MMQRITLLLGALMCVSGTALAGEQRYEDPYIDAERPLPMLAVGLRVEFGRAEARPVASLALRTTRQFIDRRVGLPVFAVDLGERGSKVGTVMGIRLNQHALRHKLDVARIGERI